MRGTIIKNGLEFFIVTEGESWNQGDVMKGHIGVRNHGPVPVTLEKLSVSLCQGDLKKNKIKANDTFTLISSLTPGEHLKVASKGEVQFPWSFQLEKDCPVSDKKDSLFLCYGPGEDLTQMANLQLIIMPRFIIQEMMSIFQTFLRFKIDGHKNAKGFVEYQLKIPATREYSTFESLSCRLRHADENLQVQYHFKVKILENVGKEVLVQAKKKEIEQVLQPGQYQLFEGAPNQDGLMKALQEAIESAKPKMFY